MDYGDSGTSQIFRERTQRLLGGPVGVRSPVVTVVAPPNHEPMSGLGHFITGTTGALAAGALASRLFPHPVVQAGGAGLGLAARALPTLARLGAEAFGYAAAPAVTESIVPGLHGAIDRNALPLGGALGAAATVALMRGRGAAKAAKAVPAALNKMRVIEPHVPVNPYGGSGTSAAMRPKPKAAVVVETPVVPAAPAVVHTPAPAVPIQHTLTTTVAKPLNVQPPLQRKIVVRSEPRPTRAQLFASRKPLITPTAEMRDVPRSVLPPVTREQQALFDKEAAARPIPPIGAGMKARVQVEPVAAVQPMRPKPVEVEVPAAKGKMRVKATVAPPAAAKVNKVAKPEPTAVSRPKRVTKKTDVGAPMRMDEIQSALKQHGPENAAAEFNKLAKTPLTPDEMEYLKVASSVHGNRPNSRVKVPGERKTAAQKADEAAMKKMEKQKAKAESLPTSKEPDVETLPSRQPHAESDMVGGMAFDKWISPNAPTTLTPAQHQEFETRLRDAFQSHGGPYGATMLDLRKAMKGFTPSQFDAGLEKMIQNRKVSASVAENRTPPTDAEARAFFVREGQRHSLARLLDTPREQIVIDPKKTRFLGSDAEYTGRTGENNGQVWHEVHVLEGKYKGQNKWMQNDPEPPATFSPPPPSMPVDKEHELAGMMASQMEERLGEAKSMKKKLRIANETLAGQPEAVQAHLRDRLKTVAPDVHNQLELGSTSVMKGEDDAARQVGKQEISGTEHQNRTGGGEAAEAGGSNRPQRSAPSLGQEGKATHESQENTKVPVPVTGHTVETAPKPSASPATSGVKEDVIPTYTRTTPDAEAGRILREERRAKIADLEALARPLERQASQAQAMRDKTPRSHNNKRRAFNDEYLKASNAAGELRQQQRELSREQDLALIEDQLQSPQSYEHYLSSMVELHRLKAAHNRGLIETVAKRKQIGPGSAVLAETRLNEHNAEADRHALQLLDRIKGRVSATGRLGEHELSNTTDNAYLRFSLSGNLDDAVKEAVNNSVSLRTGKAQQDLNKLEHLGPEEKSRFASELTKAAEGGPDWKQNVNTILGRAAELNTRVGGEKAEQARLAAEEMARQHSLNAVEGMRNARQRNQKLMEEPRYFASVAERAKELKGPKEKVAPTGSVHENTERVLEREQFHPDWSVETRLAKNDKGVLEKAHTLQHTPSGLAMAVQQPSHAKQLVTMLEDQGIKLGKETSSEIQKKAKRVTASWSDASLHHMNEEEQKTALGKLAHVPHGLDADVVINKSDLGYGSKGIHVTSAKGNDYLKKLADEVPEFSYDPVFTVTKDKRLSFRDGYHYEFDPQAFNLHPDELHVGQTVGFDLGDMGIKRATQSDVVANAFSNAGWTVKRSKGGDIQVAKKGSLPTTVSHVRDQEWSAYGTNQDEARKVLSKIRWRQPGQIKDTPVATAAKPPKDTASPTAAPATSTGKMKVKATVATGIQNPYGDTPDGANYIKAKTENPNHVVLVKKGHTYEAFGGDAMVLSQKLGVTLSTLDKHARSPVPMAGIPEHDLEGYVTKLAKDGIKVKTIESPPMRAKPAEDVSQQLARTLNEFNVMGKTPQEIDDFVQKTLGSHSASIKAQVAKHLRINQKVSGTQAMHEIANRLQGKRQMAGLSDAGALPMKAKESLEGSE